MPLLLLLAAGCGLLVWWLVRSEDARSGAGAGPRAPATRGAGRGAASSSGPAESTTAKRLFDARRALALGRLLLQGTWGSAPGQFGERPAEESNPEGPMGLAVDPHGNVLVLDQVNQRLQRFGPDGRYVSSLPIASATAQDLLVDAEGRALVLTRLGGAPAIEVFSSDGKPSATLPALGGPLKEGGAITGLFADSRGIYVEDSHDDLLRISDGAGRRLETPEIVPGRPSRDGRLYLKAGVIDKPAGRVYVQAHGADRKLAWETPLELGEPLLHILLLDSDLKGHVYLGAEVGREDPATREMVGLGTLVARLDGSGRLAGTLALPPSTADAHETFRPLVVGNDGAIYHLVPSGIGIRVTVYRFDDGAR